jgi:hypothetical protein
MRRPFVMLLSAVSLLCSCGKPLPPGTYTVKTTVLTQKSDRLDRRYEIETTGLRKLCLRSESGEDSGSLAPDIMTKERTGKAEATLTITRQGLHAEQQKAVLAMVVKAGSVTSRFKRELPIPEETSLITLLSETRIVGGIALTNKTTLLRLASGDRWLELSVE